MLRFQLYFQPESQWDVAECCYKTTDDDDDDDDMYRKIQIASGCLYSKIQLLRFDNLRAAIGGDR